MNLLPEPTAMSHQIHTYTELRQQIHDDLRIQHPEWVEPNGESSMCLMEELDTLTRRGSDESLLPKVPPGLEGKVERAFRKLCEALSMAEGTSEALGGWAHRDPDRLHGEEQVSDSFVRD